MLETLVIIQKFMLFLLLTCFAFYVSRYKTDKSILITLSAIFVSEFFMFAIEEWLWAIENKKLLWFAWFNTFAWCEIIVAVCIFKLHQRDFVPFSFAARSVIYSYLFLASIQLLAYLDRAYLKIEIILDFYQVAIPTISVSLMLVLFHAVGKDVYSSYKEKRGKLHAT